VDYEIVCTSESVAGIRAAISAGVAVGVLPQCAFTDRIRRLTDPTLPPLGETALVLTRSTAAPTRLADSLAAIVTRTVRTLEPTASGST
jgi:DNA-binding transcriptional LysR family regulator